MKRKKKKKPDVDMGWLKDLAHQRAEGQCQAQTHSTHCTGLVSFSYGHAHHVKPRSLGGLDEIENLVFLHPDCHAEIHSWPDRSREQGLLKNRYDDD